MLPKLLLFELVLELTAGRLISNKGCLAGPTLLLALLLLLLLALLLLVLALLLALLLGFELLLA
jgi:hypothetical protein